MGDIHYFYVIFIAKNKLFVMRDERADESDVTAPGGVSRSFPVLLLPATAATAVLLGTATAADHSSHSRRNIRRQ